MMSFSDCSKEKWEGRIYEEEGVTVIENMGLGLWGNEIKSKIMFEENLSIGAEEGLEYLLFHTDLDIAVDSELNIYVLDIKNHRLLKFDKMGTYIWKSGRKGQGPGEFRNPSSVSVSSSKEVCVLDSSALIHVFNNQGKYQRTLNLRGRCRDFQFLPDGQFLINKSTRGQMGVSAEIYSSDGQFLEKFNDEYLIGPDLPEWAGGSIGGGGYWILDGKIYMVLPDRYEIREYNIEGKLLRKIIRDFKLEQPVLKKYQSGFSMTTSNVIGPCFLYKENILLNSLMLVEKTGEHEYELHFILDFFNKKGQFLGSYESPEERMLKYIDANNNFYFIQENPYPRVIRSSLSIEDGLH